MLTFVEAAFHTPCVDQRDSSEGYSLRLCPLQLELGTPHSPEYTENLKHNTNHFNHFKISHSLKLLFE